MPTNYTQDLINIMQAYLKGETIEYKYRKENPLDVGSNPWKGAETPSWDFGTYEYRIKPKFYVTDTLIYATIKKTLLTRNDLKDIARDVAQYALDCMSDPKLAEEARQIVNV